jgi:DnaK suppressor protein
MNKTFLTKVKENLLTQKRDLTIKSTQSVVIDTDGDETDEIQGNLIMDLANHLSSRDTAKLRRIDSALQRIEERTYGLCQDCGEKIPNARLLANPHFLTCVACAEERERDEKQRKRS